MKTISRFTLMLLAAAMTMSCSHLSDKAEDMVGNYYQTAISENEPVMELNDDGTCTIHAIKPNVMSYEVKGEWNVENDSLLIETDGVASNVVGDTTVVRVGNIPTHMSYAITSFNGLTLTLNRDGTDYSYVRRGHSENLDK